MGNEQASMNAVQEIINSGNFCPTIDQINKIKTSANAMNTYIGSLCPRKNGAESDTFLVQNFGVVKKVLGQGGFGTVYLSMKGNKPFALKIPINMNQIQNLFQELYSSECIAKSTENTDLQNYYGTVSQCIIDKESRLVMQMDYLPQSFGDKIKKKYSDGFYNSSQEVQKQMLIDMLLIAKEIKLLHDHNVAHRDLKPENIMVNWKDEPMLVDFGGSSLKGNEFDGFVGTPYFIDKDLVNLEKNTFGKANDIYSLGIIFMVMIYGNGIYVQLEKVLRAGNFQKALNQNGTFTPDYSFFTFQEPFEWVESMIASTSSRIVIENVILNLENILTAFNEIEALDHQILIGSDAQIIKNHVANLVQNDSSPVSEELTEEAAQLKYKAGMNNMQKNVWNIWIKKNNDALKQLYQEKMKNGVRIRKEKVQYIDRIMI
jgi:serine/threonine protein kinase